MGVSRVKPKPATYSGTEQEWQALSTDQRGRIRHAVKISAYYKKNAVQYAARNKAYHEVNKGTLNAKCRAYYHVNSDTILAKQRAYRLEKEKTFIETWGEDGIQP